MVVDRQGRALFYHHIVLCWRVRACSCAKTETPSSMTVPSPTTEIRDDKEGIESFDRFLGQLNKKKEFLVNRMDENGSYAAAFDEKIGPFEKMYEGLTKDIDILYKNAKKQHAKGLEVLKREFDYHPLFKRRDGEFTGTPFQPK